MTYLPKVLPVLVAAVWTAAPCSAADLSVRVEGLRSRAGTVAVCLFRSRAKFPDCRTSPGALSATVAAGETDRAIVFKDLKPGSFALSVLHDENANGRLDTGLFGRPQEGIGISNDRLPRFSAPSFADAAFDLARSGTKSVRVVYR